MGQIATTNSQIDRLVYEIYDVTDEETVLIEDIEIQGSTSEEQNWVCLSCAPA